MKLKGIVTFLVLLIGWDATLGGEYKLRDATQPEDLVYSKTSDGIFNAGVVFHGKHELAKPVAVILIHGWGVNFYAPSYISIGRDLADKGYTCISGNTRMHDLGNVEGYKNGARIRGGGVWGLAGDQTRDIAGWIDFSEAKGFKKIVLVGHSAGCAAVRIYQAEKQDRRVIGLVFGSGNFHPDVPIDPSLVSQAAGFTSQNKGEKLVEDPKRSFPSYTSAGTIMDIVNTPAEYKDFFGVQTTNAGVRKIQCPILAFYGTAGDIGNEKDLELLKSCIKKLPTGPVSVTTAMIEGADHMYMGEEQQVCDVITTWMARVFDRGK